MDQPAAMPQQEPMSPHEARSQQQAKVPRESVARSEAVSSDDRAIEIDFGDDAPPALSVPDPSELPAAVDEHDMSYFGENSADTEPLGLEEDPVASAGTIGVPLPPPSEPRIVEAEMIEPVAPESDQDIEIGSAVILPRFSEVKRSEVVPVRIYPDHLVVETGGGNRSKLELRRIQAVACAVVEDVSANPVLIIDLLLNWRDTEGEVLNVVRMLSSSFDPGVLLPNAGVGMQALRTAVQRLQTGAGAEALPSAAALAGQPFPRFGRLADYEREVLDVGSG
jgi:hypothetical protein